MSLPRTVAEILREHVTLDVESIDRMYLNAYVPRLQYESGVAAFFRRHRGHPFASSALMEPISKAFVAAIHAFVARAGRAADHLREGPAEGRRDGGAPGALHRRRGRPVRRPGPGEDAR